MKDTVLRLWWTLRWKGYTNIFAIYIHSDFTDKWYIVHKWINMKDQDNNEKIKLHTWLFLIIHKTVIHYMLWKTELFKYRIFFWWIGTWDTHFSTLITTSVINRNDNENVPTKERKVLQRERFCFTQLFLTYYNMHI